jgi:hypothetical protein
MRHAFARVCTALTVIATAFVTACGMADTEATAEAARAKAQETWKLTLDGAEPLTLERMDIFLVEGDTEAEVFKLYGDDVTLVGEFPTSLHVGYEEEFGRLFGKTIELGTEGGDPDEPASAFVTIDGEKLSVVGGSLKAERVTGKWDGSDGDKTLWGTVEIVVEGDDGERTLRGTFAVNIVTWG